MGLIIGVNICNLLDYQTPFIFLPIVCTGLQRLSLLLPAPRTLLA